MNRHFTSLIALGLCCFGATASQLTPEEALGRLTTAIGIVHKIPAAKLQLAYTATSGDINQFYVFNSANNTGYSIVAADDCVPALLGYSDSGNFDYADMPDNMKAWLESYQEQIDWAIANGVNATATESRAIRPEIAPLIKTQWDQSAPYNNLCPDYAENVKSASGCVATAMAQIMKYHEWPVKGKGSNSYNCYNTSIGVNLGTLSMNFANTTFDWANMTDRYTSSSTAAQNDAVATLMYACGISVNMMYGPSSGAQSIKASEAFINYFDYDKATTYCLRDYYGGTEWEEMIYNELAAMRPVLYDGVTYDYSGHEFVCDGYSNGYFHINWGWGGMSDGYFLLSVLDPGIQGTGGANSGFNFSQGATIGIQKPVEGSVSRAPLVADDEFYLDKTTYSRSETFRVRNRSYIYYLGFGTMKVRLGMKLTDAEGKDRYIFSTASTSPMVGMSSAIRDYMMKGDNFPQSGTYTATPAFYNADTEKWNDILIPINCSPGFQLEIEGDKLTFTPIAYAPELKISNIKVLSPLYNKTNFHITATATVGNQEFYGPVIAALYKKGSTIIANRSSNVMLDVLPGQELEIDMVNQFTRTIEAGEYDLVFIDTNNKKLSDPVTVNYLGTLPGETSVELVEFKPAASSMPQNQIKLVGTLKCTAGQVADPLSVYLFAPGNNYSVALWSTDRLWLSEGETADFVIEGQYLDGTVGIGQYTAVAYFNNNELTPYARFRLKKATTDIDDITTTVTAVTPNPADNYITVTAPSIDIVDIYSITGMHVLSVNGNDCESLGIDITNLASGNYIITVKGDDEVKTLRFIKR